MTRHSKWEKPVFNYSALGRRTVLYGGICCYLSFGAYAQHWNPNGLQIKSSASRIRNRSIGVEIAVPAHLSDGAEYSIAITDLIASGKVFFEANWTEEEGGGRPLTKGTGRSLSDSSVPLRGSRAFNRISAPDANSCAG